MGLFDIFKRPAPVRDAAALADFIDRHAAFVAQKGIYEYSRARAGHYAKVLFGEPGFQAAVEQSRWRAFPLGLAMVAEVADSVLHSGSSDRERLRGLDALDEIVIGVFDRYPAPQAIEPQEWRDRRGELDRRLKLIGTHPPKRAMDIPEIYVKSYFDLMPIHEKLRQSDFPTTHNYLKVVLCNVHEELSKRADLPALARSDALEAAK